MFSKYSTWVYQKKKKKYSTWGDDVVNLTSKLHDSNAQVNHLHKRRKQKDLAKGTGVVPAKYPPKVKLEIFSQL